MESNQSMLKAFMPTLIKVGIGLLVILLIIVFNQVVQIVNFMSGIHPLLGTISLFVLIVILAILFLLPLVSFIRYKKMPELPQDENSNEYEEYLENILNRLERNKNLKELGYIVNRNNSIREEVEKGYLLLNNKSREIIKSKATGVFLTTAISQNGVLDGFFILGTLTKMIWQITIIYEQRPSFSRLMALYGNVAGTVLMARGLEDLDLIDEQIEPLITSILGGGLATLVPGAVTVTNIVVNSITEGSINALLTLRVGCITQRYLSATTRPNKSILRRSATMEACTMLGAVMKDNTMIIIKAFGKGAKRAAKNTFKF